MRQLHARQSLAHPQIEMVQRTRLYPHQHLVFAQLRIGNAFVGENLGPAELMDANGFHGRAPALRDYANTFPWAGRPEMHQQPGKNCKKEGHFRHQLYWRTEGKKTISLRIRNSFRFNMGNSPNYSPHL